LTAIPRTNRRIDLTWTDNSAGESGFRIYHSIDGIHYLELGTSNADVTRYHHKGAAVGTTYKYRVQAYNAGGPSAVSNTASTTTLNAPLFSETWDSVSRPIYPDDQYTTASTGTVERADNVWTWQTENDYVTSTGFRLNGISREVGRFAAGAQSGDFNLDASMTPFNFNQSDTLFASFEADVDTIGSDSERVFTFALRNETDYGGGSHIAILLDAETDQPAIKIKSRNVGSDSNVVESASGIDSYGSANRYWIDARFAKNGASLDVEYEVYNENDFMTPVLSGSNSLNQIPELNLDQVQLTFQQRAIGSIDDLFVNGQAGAGQQSLLLGEGEGGETTSGFAESGPMEFSLGQVTIGGSFSGTSLDGATAGDMVGYSVSSLGDVNGDGFEDAIVGAPWTKFDPQATTKWDLYSGEAYLLFGPVQTSTNGINLKPIARALPNSPPVFAAGLSVSGAGDVNRDGYNDILVGAPWGIADNQQGSSGRASGEVYLIFGRQDIGGDLSSPDQSRGVIFEGAAQGDNAGLSVASAGDFDGDGYADILIGAPEADAPDMANAGRVYLISGKRLSEGLPSVVDLASLEYTADGVVFLGVGKDDHAGFSVTGAGDANGDGLADILIGAPGRDDGEALDIGAVYLVYGRSFTGLTGTPYSLSQIDGSNGVVFEGIAAFDQAGSSVAGSGDVNGDGLADILIGAPNADVNGNDEAGESYLVYGKQGGVDHVGGGFSLASSCLQTSGRGLLFQGEAPHDFAGASVSIIADRDGDGYDDLLIGAPGADEVGKTDAGITYLIDGSGLLSGGDLGTTVGMSLVGELASDAFGFSVSGAGDVCNPVDGLSDLLIGAAKASPDSKTEAGKFYLLKGYDSTPLSPSIYIANTAAGDAPRTAIGAVESAVPSSRCWIDFENGTGSGYTSASQEIVILTRNNSGISGLSNVATVRWEIQTSRSGWSGARVTFKYLDSEVSGLTVSNLRLYQSASLGGGWALLADQSHDQQINEISGTVSSLTSKYFAIADAGSGDTQTIHVYPGAGTIQQALDGVDEGGTVIVHPGTYYENIEFFKSGVYEGKDITLRSLDPDNPAIVAATIIDGQLQGPVITLWGTESEDCVIEGLTLTNGSGYVYVNPPDEFVFGGGIAGFGSLATIRKNVIENNTTLNVPGTNGFGGGLAYCDGVVQSNKILFNRATGGGALYGCLGSIVDNLISGNTATVYGGGLAWCDSLIQGNTISENTADSTSGGGGGLYECKATIEKNTIQGNYTRGYGGGMLWCFDTIRNNVIFNNRADQNGGGMFGCNATILNNTIVGNSLRGLAYCRSSETGGRDDIGGITTTIKNCILWNNWTGGTSENTQLEPNTAVPTYSFIQGWTGDPSYHNITAPDAGLIELGNGNHQLAPHSPCIDAGDPSTVLPDDLDGHVRPFGPAVDIGAYEFSLNYASVIQPFNPTPNKYYFYATLQGAQVVYPSSVEPSTAYGFGSFILDRDAKTLTFSIAYRALESALGSSQGFETYSQIRGPASRGSNSGTVLHQFASTGPYKSGVWNYAEGRNSAQVQALENDLLASRIYVEIHSLPFNDFHNYGELRGQIEIDTDVDGVTDYDESTYYDTDPLDRDSDDDGLLDGEEIRGIGRLSHLPKPFDLSAYLERLASKNLDEGETYSAYSFLRAFVTDPLLWDTDGDDLADGLEIGVTSMISSYSDGSHIVNGTSFLDSNEDGIHDTNGYRLVDLGPNEPPTDPRLTDTNSNGIIDGDEDLNRNGRIDTGETDPVIGFYSRARSYINGGQIILMYDDVSPEGDGYYGEFVFDFGSLAASTADFTVTNPSGASIQPSALSVSNGRRSPLSIFVTAAAGAQSRSLTVNGNSTTTLATAASSGSDFPSWVTGHFQGQPPVNYRVDCDDFCKMAFWSYLGGNLSGSKVRQDDPVKWDSEWGYFLRYDKNNPGNHLIIYPNAVDIEHSAPGVRTGNVTTPYFGGTTVLYEVWPLSKIPDTNSNGIKGLSGVIGDSNRTVDWDDLLPGDIFFLNYHDNAKPDHNYAAFDTTGQYVDHAVMLVSKPESGIPAIFAWGTYWSYASGWQFVFQGGLVGNATTDMNGFYLPESALLPLPGPLGGYHAPLDYDEIVGLNGQTIDLSHVNSLDAYLKGESENKVGSSNWSQFVQGIRRWTINRN
jgi:hypothetical protein